MGNLLGITALLLAAGTLGFWWRGMQAVNLPRDRTRFFTAAGLAFALGSAAFFHEASLLASVSAGLGMLISGIFLTLGAFSAQADLQPAVAVGGSMLEFSAPADTGEVFQSTTLSGKPYLLKFFRGHW